ncbi:hypothetical protein J2741_000839 [Methanolinea mesophila]|nr:hypothetical protein [Methanolinea mesophila]
MRSGPGPGEILDYLSLIVVCMGIGPGPGEILTTSRESWCVGDRTVTDEILDYLS